MNVGVSGVYSFFTGEMSTAVNFAKESSVSTDSIMVVVEYNYIDNKKMIYTQTPKFDETMLFNSVSEFRRECGDRYLSEIEVGARLYYVFTSEYHSSNKRSKKDVEAAIKAGFGKIFNITSETKMSKEQEEIFNQTNISINCLTQGVSDPTVCSSRHNASEDKEDMTKALANMELAFTSAVRDYPDFIVIKQKFNRYPMFKLFENSEIADYQKSINTRLVNIDNIVRVSEKADAICSGIDFNQGVCDRFKRTIGRIVDSCLETMGIYDGSCEQSISEQSLMNLDDYKTIINSVNAGSITFYEDGPFRGRTISFDFNQLFSNYSDMQPYKILNFTVREYSFNDRASSYSFDLRDGWRIRMYEHINGKGRSLTVQGKGRVGSVPNGWNDRISSIVLERYKD